MASIIKYVRNRNPLSSNYDSSSGADNQNSNTPYLNLEESVNVDKSTNDLTTQYSSTSNNNINDNYEPKITTPDAATDATQSNIFLRPKMFNFVG